MATPTNCEPALESELPQYWEFSVSINTSIDSALCSQNSKSALLNQKSKFARLITSSVKKRWPSSYILLKIKTRAAKPGLDVCGIIRTSAAIDVNDLQAGIKRQAKKVDKDFNTEDPGVIKLKILKDDFDAGGQAYNLMNEYAKAAASYGGDLQQFIKLAFDTLCESWNYNEIKKAGEIIQLCTGSNCGWFEYGDNRFGSSYSFA